VRDKSALTARWFFAIRRRPDTAAFSFWWLKLARPLTAFIGRVGYTETGFLSQNRMAEFSLFVKSSMIENFLLL